jgi:hypothetical protein
VNGDGYADVIVGAHEYSNGETEEGRAYVFFGSGSGPDTAPDWFAEGNRDAAHFGFSVGTAGDVNADGYADVVVGARNFSSNFQHQGRAYVFHGSPTGPSAAANWTASGEHDGANFGYSVSTAGDVNADGYGDVVVGSPFYGVVSGNQGRAYVYTGSAGGLTSSPTILPGAEGDMYVGYSVATAGDVNGDGYADVVVGAPRADGAELNEGQAFVYMGSAAGAGTAVAWTGTVEQLESWFGVSVATAGDVNGDGISDVLVGASNYDVGPNQVGGAFVFHGAADPPATAEAVKIEGNQAGEGLGVAESAGDVNGDGYSDVILGHRLYTNPENHEGRAAVHLGSANGLESVPAWLFESDQANATLGESVASAGDVNGDGYGDVIVGAPAYTNDTAFEGRAYVFHGSPTGPSPTPDWIAEGDATQANFGVCVASAGDVNGDGYGDVVIGADLHSNPEEEEGRAYVYLGSPSGLEPTPAWMIEGNEEFGTLGHSVACAGDVNGDGYSDVLVGFHNANTIEVDDAGVAWVFHGSSDGPSSRPDWEGSIYQYLSGYGISVAGAGDVNGDGYGDIAVSARFFDGPDNNEGAVFVYHGSAAGLSPSPDFTIQGNQADAMLDETATAGDVNGDGFSDLIVGATHYDSGQQNEGKAWIFYGRATGLNAWVAWSDEIDQAQAFYGWDVASAGDVNGDGYDDVLVGASAYTGDQAFEGAIYLYLGNQRTSAHAELALRPRQHRPSGETVQLLGSTYDTALRLNTRGRTPAGRIRVRLEYDVAPLGDGFGPVPDAGAWLDSGPAVIGQGSAVVLDELVAALDQDPHRWRVRVASESPYFPHGPWMAMPTSVPSLTQCRAGAVVGVEAQEPAFVTGIGIESVRPNPVSTGTTIAYRLAAATAVRVEVFDVAGRRVASLVDGFQESGRHVAAWGGRDDEGRKLGAGTYVVRIVTPGKEWSRKITVAK